MAAMLGSALMTAALLPSPPCVQHAVASANSLSTPNTLNRRRALLLPFIAAAPLSPLLASAANDAASPTIGQTYVDKEYGVSFGLPAGWNPTESELSGGRKLVAAADPSDVDFNIFIAYTPIAADYTSLGSFGNIDSVGLTLLPQCAGSSCSLASDGIQGKMISQATQSSAYVFDYSIEQIGQPIRRLRTLFSVQTEVGRGKNLVTLTAQCKQARYDELAPTLRAVIDSFKYT